MFSIPMHFRQPIILTFPSKQIRFKYLIKLMYLLVKKSRIKSGTMALNSVCTNVNI